VSLAQPNASDNELRAFAESLSAYLVNQPWQAAALPMLRYCIALTASPLALLCAGVEHSVRVIAMEGTDTDRVNSPDFHRALSVALADPGYVELQGLDHLLGSVIKTGEVVIMNSPATDPRFAQLPDRKAQVQSFLGVPLRKGDEVVGVLGVADHAGGYDPNILEDLGFISALASIYCDAYRRDQRIQRIEQQFFENRRIELLGRLTAGVAHEFNNLLQAILGYSESLGRDMDKSHPKHGEFHDLRMTAEKGMLLTQQLIKYSAKPAQDGREFDINLHLEELHPLLDRIIREDITVVMLLNPALGPVNMDAAQFQQVILSLAANADEAMPSGGRITIKTANAELAESSVSRPATLPPGAYSCITFSDSGTGIPVDILDRVFDPFFTTASDGARAGLGLTVVQSIIRQHGGEVVAASAPGQGARFTIYLPRLTTADRTMIVTTDESEQEEDAAVEDTRASGETLLLAEDEDAVRNLAQRVLERAGYAVIPATNGVAALEAAGAHNGPIDILVTDVIMPEMGGKDLAQRLVAIYPKVKVLYMSGYTGTTLHKAGVRETVSAYLQKPFRSAELLRKVREVIEGPQIL
jgi:signal transduction histidine kinase/ActR/RegA family two-component response regulator